MTAAILAEESEFKRAMKAADIALDDLIDPESAIKTTFSTTYNFDDTEVNNRPAVQQWTV